VRGLKKIIVERNARSTTEKNREEFVKTSDELSLFNEANELERCRAAEITTTHVKALDFISYDKEKNDLTTRTVLGGQSLFNRLWNETSIISPLLSKEIDVDVVLSRMQDIGEWLRLYHDSTECPEASEQVSLSLQETFKKKVAYIRTHRLVNEGLINGFEKKVFPEIEKLVDCRYQEENGIRFCRVHGDFVAYNMIVDPEWNIYVADFADTHIGVSTEDVGRFCELLYAVAETSRKRESLFTQAVNVFLGAYGASKKIDQSPFFKTIRAYNVLLHLISEFSMRPYVRKLLLTRMELRRISNASVRWLSKELAG